MGKLLKKTKIRIERLSCVFGCAAKCKIELDSICVAKIANGQTVEIWADYGFHTVSICWGWKKETIDICIEEDDEIITLVTELNIVQNSLIFYAEKKVRNAYKYAVGNDLTSSPKNSFDVIERVRELQPEIDKLIELEYIESVERWLENISDYKKSLLEKFDLYKKHKIKIEKYMVNELKEIELAEKLSGKEKERYISEKAKSNMNMFGSCHVIWNLQKKILKEKYNIDWLTPQEEHPEIMFD